MTPFHHSSCNDVLHPPRGVEIEQCVPLKITRVYVDGGVERHAMPGDDTTRRVPITKTFAPEEGLQVLSFWQPDADELALIMLGRPIVIGVQGMTHPPLWVAVAKDK